MLPIEKEILVEVEHKNTISSNFVSQKTIKIDFKKSNINITQLIFKIRETQLKIIANSKMCCACPRLGLIIAHCEFKLGLN